MASTNSREYDLILLGATGYTGKLTAEYITRHLPQDLNWAVAGRKHAKLADMVEGLRGLQPDRKQQPAIETTELSKEDLNNLVRKTRVLITTVGPFHLYGSAVMEACAAAGTHYVDSSGETPWVYEATQKYHSLAKTNKAILITQCGMDSAPADLVAYLLVSFLRSRFDQGTAELVHGVQEFNNAMSGGTLHSLIGVASAYPLGHLRRALDPLSLCADGARPSVAPGTPRWYNVLGSHRKPGIGLLTDSVIGVSDTNLVYRSWSLMDGGKYYGMKFGYFTGMKAANRLSGFAWHASIVVGQAMLLLAPVRWLLMGLIPRPGEGPDEVAKAKCSTTWQSVAHSDSAESPHTAVCKMSFAGDMYSLTAILLAEAALVLLRSDRENWAQKIGGGVLTPATLGDQFVERVKAAGLKSEVELVDGWVGRFGCVLLVELRVDGMV